MAYQELDSYIAEQIGKGLDAQTVKRTLLEAGWLEVDVDNALRDVAADAVPATAVAVHDDIVNIRHTLKDLEKRVHALETRTTAAPDLPAGAQEPVLPSGRADAEHVLPKPHAWTKRKVLTWGGLTVLFLFIGYVGMRSLAQDVITPVSRIWAEVAVGVALTSAGFILGRMKRHAAANWLTGTGLAFGALATVGAWYLNYLDWSVALALGALLVTLALVLGRFYDVWAFHEPMPRTA